MPAFATSCFRYQVEDDPTSDVVFMGMRCPVDREAHLFWMEGRLSQEMWSKVVEHEANSGLWWNEPHCSARPRRYTRIC